jgi:hypothetical protein
MTFYERIMSGEFENTVPYVQPRDNKEAYEEYRKGEQAALARFKQELYKEYKVEDNPKKDVAFQIAWERGHASGLYEVYSIFDDLVELIE